MDLFYIEQVKNRKGNGEILWCYSQSVCYQQLYDEPFGLSAQLGKHTLFKSHIIVSDVQHRAAVILSSKWGNSRQAGRRKSCILYPMIVSKSSYNQTEY